jgi:hypothetical protein
MRFMMMVESGAKAEAGILPDEKLLAAMGQYNEELIKAGAMLAGEGLHPTAKGVRVRLAGKKLTVTDGPFGEGKELIGGFWLIQAASRQEAIEWAKRVPGREGGIEIRQLYELSDFPADPSEQPDGWREQEQRFRESADAAPPAGAQSPPVRKPGTSRYMVMLRGDRMTESGDLPDQKTLAAMGALMGELAQSGALLSGEGLKPSAGGARVKLSGDKRTVIDGPFAEAKELIAGYSIIQVKTRAEAVEFAKRLLQIHVDGLDLEEGEIDVRPVAELSDFPVDAAETPEGWRQQEQRFRDRTGQ